MVAVDEVNSGGGNADSPFRPKIERSMGELTIASKDGANEEHEEWKRKWAMMNEIGRRRVEKEMDNDE